MKNKKTTIEQNNTVGFAVMHIIKAILGDFWLSQKKWVIWFCDKKGQKENKWFHVE